MRFVMCTTLLLGLLRSLLFLMGVVSELGLKNFCFKSVRRFGGKVSSVVEGGTKKRNQKKKRRSTLWGEGGTKYSWRSWLNLLEVRQHNTCCFYFVVRHGFPGFSARFRLDECLT